MILDQGLSILRRFLSELNSSNNYVDYLNQSSMRGTEAVGNVLSEIYCKDMLWDCED
jgi:hypothetical protein